jgi:hypothetical protein
MPVSQQDAEIIIQAINEAYRKIPWIFRGQIPSMPTILAKLPYCARKYTLQELIDLLEWAHANKLIP